MSNAFTGNENDDDKRSLIADDFGNSARNVIDKSNQARFDMMITLLESILVALGGTVIADKLLLEDNISFVLLENGDEILLE